MRLTPKARRAGRWSALDAPVAIVVTAAAAVLRLVRLSDPRTLVFDETYYAKDACWYALASRSVCGVESEQTAVHPPLGKWLIAAGVEAFGYDSFGWRVAATVAGAGTVALLYVLARRLLASTLGATLSAGLLAVDPLHFVQSRVAMLDVFVVAFGVAAVLFIVVHRDRTLGRRDPPDRSARASPWRVAAGAAAGGAVASKWSGIFYLLMVAWLAVAWSWAARPAAGGLRRYVRSEGAGLALSLGVAPVLVYVLSYVGRLEGAVVATPGSPGSWLRALWDRQSYMLDFHSGLEATHPYASPPWSWLLLKRPVSYFFETTAGGEYMEIFATGSPLVWWASILGLAFVAWRWPRHGGLGRPEGVVLAGFVFNYVPWLLLARGRPAVFLFYLLPAVPFMCLALGYVAASARHRARAPATAAFAAAAIALFAFYYPLLANVAIPRDQWLQRIWVFDDCATPPPTETATEAAQQRTDGGRPPPQGWCWI